VRAPWSGDLHRNGTSGHRIRKDFQQVSFLESQEKEFQQMKDFIFFGFFFF